MIVFYEALCYRCEVSVAGVETGGGLLCFLFIIVLAGGRGKGGIRDARIMSERDG
jgi:hypothetical protein